MNPKGIMTKYGATFYPNLLILQGPTEFCSHRNNGKDAKVGSCCVKKFIGLPSDKIFKAVNRVRNDVEKSLNVEALKYAKEKGLIGDWDYNFYISVGAKRSLSEKQWDSKIKINEKFLRRIRQKSVLGKLS